MGLFGAAHRWGEGPKRPPFPKIRHTNPTIIKLGRITPCLQKIKKMYE